MVRGSSERSTVARGTDLARLAERRPRSWSYHDPGRFVRTHMSLLSLLRTLVRRIGRLVPVEHRRRLLVAALRVRERFLIRDFARASAAGPLGIDVLLALHEEHPVRPRDYGRTPDDYLARGEERLRDVRRFVAPPARVLEIGAGDGMASRAMQLAGYDATITDIVVDELDPRVRPTGVTVVRGDATTLAFADESFDCVFSYNAFEHLPDPAATFGEMRRVLRPGGVGFVSFAGLGWSPEGAHLTQVTGVPYANVLFSPESIDAFRRECAPNAWVPWINAWPIDRFRSLFRSAPDVETLEYVETRNLFHLDVLARFLPHVRHAPSWDALVVDSVRFVIRRLAREPVPRPRHDASAGVAVPAHRALA